MRVAANLQAALSRLIKLPADSPSLQEGDKARPVTKKRKSG
jgi:hypothetical protein